MKTAHAKALNQSPRYRKFVTERDQALEAILDKYLRAQDRLLSFLRTQTLTIASHMSHRGITLDQKRQARATFEARISQYFALCQAESIRLMLALRKTTFTLACAGETEAIARALGKPCKFSIHKDKIGKIHAKDTPSGGDVAARVELAYSRLKRDVLDAFQLSQTLESPLDEMLDRLKRAFPSSKSLKRPPNALRSIQESDVTDLNQYKLGKVGLSSGTVDSDTWEEMLDDYTSDELPASIYARSPADKILFFSVDEDGQVDMTQRYEWELENEMTEDFVSSVRAGEIDAANQNGISDFMWLAVIDKRTDDCCAVRDGLSSSEIEDKLESGDIDSSECDAITPPAHFNCRCRPVPVSDDLPDEAPPDFGSFDDWLAQKAQEADAA